jgi:hypothetical protein
MSSAPTEPTAPDVTIDDESTAPMAMPRDSSPTWELEMLISGAVTFSLFQLPPKLDHLYAHWHLHATDVAATAMLAVYMVVKGGLYTLIAAFVIHLGVRAYWVGLIGLNSVYPDGVHWDRVLMVGPTMRGVLRERMQSLPRIIAQLDNFASVIFSFAFLIVLLLAITLPFVALAGLLTYAISSFAFGGRHLALVVAVVFALFMLPASVLLFDMRRGARLAPDGARRLRRVLGVVYRTQLMGITGPVLYTIGSSGRRKTAYAAFYLALCGAFAVVLVEMVLRSGAIDVSGARFFSTQSSVNSLDYNYYESTWTEDDVDERAPSIQDDVITGPFVRLFIPYRPSRHDPAIAERCPHSPPLTTRGIHLGGLAGQTAAADSAAVGVLRCLASMHDVRLDGRPVPDLRFRFAKHPKTGVDGIVAYIPTADLPRGENTLTVMPPPRRPPPPTPRWMHWLVPARAAAAPEPYVIAFWY